MINDLFAGMVLLYSLISSPFILINAWVAVNEAEEETLGCPDPELHDRNNKNFGVLISALDLEMRIQDPLWHPENIHKFGVKEYANPDRVGV